MIKQTINGRDVIIIHSPTTERYLVYYEGRIEDLDQRPATDQDVEYERTQIHGRLIEELGRIWGRVLAELLEPLLD